MLKSKSDFKKDDGFTLIEILVGINLSLIVITSIISFYIFSQKFILSTSKKLQEKQDILFFFSNMNELLSKQQWQANIAEEEVHIIFNHSGELGIKKGSLNYSDKTEIIYDDIDIIVLLKDTTQIKITKNSKGNFFTPEPKYLKSLEIKNFFLTMKKNGNEYKLNYYTQLNSSAQFQNLGK